MNRATNAARINAWTVLFVIVHAILSYYSWSYALFEAWNLEELDTQFWMYVVAVVSTCCLVRQFEKLCAEIDQVLENMRAQYGKQ